MRSFLGIIPLGFVGRAFTQEMSPNCIGSVEDDTDKTATKLIERLLGWVFSASPPHRLEADGTKIGTCGRLTIPPSASLIPFVPARGYPLVGSALPCAFYRPQLLLRIGSLAGYRTATVIRAARPRAKDDPWAVLGVSRGSSMREIKRAYRKRALKDHPDVNKAPDANENFQEVSSAYDILSDPDKLKKWEAQQQRKTASAQSSQQRPQQRTRSYTSQEPKRTDWQSGSSTSDYDDPELAGAAFRGFAGAAATAADVAGKAVGVAGMAVDAVSPELGRLGRKAGSAAETAAAVAGLAGKTVLGSVSPRASRLAAMQLKELLAFLGQQDTSDTYATQFKVTPADLQGIEQEANQLQERIEVLRLEQELWDRRAKDYRASGNKEGERDALKRFIDLRDKRKGNIDELLRCYDRLDDAKRR